MKRALPYLLLFGLLYGAWFYWQQRPKPPLRAGLLPYASHQIDRISVNKPAGNSFELFRPDDGTGGWIVENAKHSLVSLEPLADQLLKVLLSIQSEGLVAPTEAAEDRLLSIRLSGPGIAEEIYFFAAPDSLPPTTFFVSLNKLADLYRVDNLDLASLPLRFESYRQKNLLDLSRLPALDSLIWWNQRDSLNYRLLDRLAGDSLTLDSLKRAWSPLRAKKYATFFNEIRDRPRLIGSYSVFSSDTSQLPVLDVYHHADWPLPYVLSSNQQLISYIAVDSLPFAVDTSWLK